MRDLRGISWKEVRDRLGDPQVVASKVRDLCLDALSLISPGEFPRIVRAVRPDTMCGHVRLRGLYEAIHDVVARRIPGDLVECGVARGGSAALMGLTMQRLEAGRTVWLFDTFEGLPPPTAWDPDYEVAMAWTGTCRGELGEIDELFHRLGIRNRYRLVKGLFQDTLPRCAVPAIAVLHLDCDWYESVATCLLHLYDRVSPGGVIQFDDYGHWKGTRRAVDEFFRQRSIRPTFRHLDYAGRQFVKP